LPCRGREGEEERKKEEREERKGENEVRIRYCLHARREHTKRYLQ
jgi:hypothetical protein